MLLSVIVPVFNGDKYLESMINSVLNQSWADFELILVDDGSTDKSGRICDIYSEKDNRIKVIHKQNGGQSEARNTGLSIAQGDLIAFADNDDILHPDMYKTLIRYLIDYEADVAACSFIHKTDQELINNIFPDSSKFAVTEYRKDILIKDFFKPTWKIPVWDKVYRKDVIEYMSFQKYRLGEDNVFSYRVLSRLNKLVYVDFPFYYQRIHENNFEFTGSQYYIELLNAKKTILDDIQISFPEEYNNAKKMLIYEGIRTYNLYVDTDTDESMILSREALCFLRDLISVSDCKFMPLGHLFTLLKIKTGHINRGKRIAF